MRFSVLHKNGYENLCMIHKVIVKVPKTPVWILCEMLKNER